MDPKNPAQGETVLSRVERQRMRDAMNKKPKRHRYRWNLRRMSLLGGWGLLLVGLFVLARIPYFYLRSWWVGSHLAQSALSAAHVKDSKSHQPVRPWPSSVLSVLEIPSLGVQAPVIQGTQMAQLNVAVGHLSSSVYPGQAGTSILAGHNATWFRHINRLKPGNLITVVDRHRILTYHVTRSAVVGVGTAVHNSSNSTIVLEACYPLDVLYLTPYRYLVWASLVSTKSTTNERPVVPPNTQYTPVGIPTSVKAQGLTLATNYLPMGTLTIHGNPSKQWRQSNAPLNAADATTTLFFAMLHIARANNPTWWHEFAPNLPYSTIRQLTQYPISHYLSQANETEIVRGSTVIQTSLSVQVVLNGQAETITTTDRVVNNRVDISSVRVQSSRK